MLNFILRLLWRLLLVPLSTLKSDSTEQSSNLTVQLPNNIVSDLRCLVIKLLCCKHILDLVLLFSSSGVGSQDLTIHIDKLFSEFRESCKHLVQADSSSPARPAAELSNVVWIVFAEAEAYCLRCQCYLESMSKDYVGSTAGNKKHTRKVVLSTCIYNMIAVMYFRDSAV